MTKTPTDLEQSRWHSAPGVDLPSVWTACTTDFRDSGRSGRPNATELANSVATTNQTPGRWQLHFRQGSPCEALK